MYGWLWRHLPGPMLAKILQALLLFLAVVAVLFLWIFPWLLPGILSDPTLGGPDAAAVPGLAPSVIMEG